MEKNSRTDRFPLTPTEVPRRRINLDLELRKLERLVRRYGEADVAARLAAALNRGTFGARYVRTLIDQRRFAAGQRQVPDPIVTGRRNLGRTSHTRGL